MRKDSEESTRMRTSRTRVPQDARVGTGRGGAMEGGDQAGAWEPRLSRVHGS